MRYLVFEGNTWEIYEELRQKDKILHKNLCKLIKEMLREDPAKGTGKPEPLKHNLSGLWSRRLSQKDRLIYKFDDKYVYIFAISSWLQLNIKCRIGILPVHRLEACSTI
jgi:toxin YoeB